MKILFLDIDGCVVDAKIQYYLNQVELFGNEPIKDYEYIKNYIKFKLEEAKRDKTEDVAFIEKVYNYVSVDMFEMLKEYRDCFLEYDNLNSLEAKLQYIEDYKKNPLTDSDGKEVPKYMKYIIESLIDAKKLIKRCLEEGRNLPFKTINEDNDIIHYTADEAPLKRAESALKRMAFYAETKDGGDDFLKACSMYIDKQIVNYDEIYTKEHLIEGVVEGLKYMLDNNLVDKIVACSHYTGPREAAAKYRLFQEELPFVEMMPESLLKFHTKPARMNERRERSSKNDQIDIMVAKIAKEEAIDSRTIISKLLDDSKPNIVILSPDKIGILFRPLTVIEINQGYLEPLEYERLIDWSIPEIERVFGNGLEKQETDIKRLIK